MCVLLSRGCLDLVCFHVAACRNLQSEITAAPGPVCTGGSVLLLVHGNLDCLFLLVVLKGGWEGWMTEHFCSSSNC